MKNFRIKTCLKSIGLACAIGLIISPLLKVKKSYAISGEEKLQSDISQKLNTLGGDWQVAIKSLEGDKNIDLYFTSQANPPSLPAASSIKTFIALATYDRIERGLLKDDEDIEKDIFSMLKYSNNQAANRLINKIGGFDLVNRTIIDITGKNLTSLNRYFAQNGPENMANARDLNLAMERIYKKDYVNIDNSSKIIKPLEESYGRYEKLLGGIKGQAWSMNKSGELPDRGVENDTAIVKVGERTFVISVLTKTSNVYNRKAQLDLMKDIGSLVFNYMKEDKVDENTNYDEGGASLANIYYYKKIDLDKSFIGAK
ncbi:MAG: serine hydrolase [Peptoniphilaceae bacterium]|nr:serine hydrolase [Peptoniphilaceae bacterium]MDY6018699.1 serine hydrolase [Anaerococcus sp.]